MKQKIFKTFLLTFLLLLIFTIPTHASEGEMTKHTITIEVPANEEMIMPYIWDNGSYSPVYSSASTAAFTVPDNNFAFETSARNSSGVACSAEYTVNLIFASTGASHAALRNTANGSLKKLDWISTYPGYSYYFKIVNHSSTPLSVYLEYYSWN